MVRTSNGDSLTSWFPNGDSLTSILFPVFLDVCWCLAGCPSAWITSGVKRRFKNAWAICTNIDPKPSATKSCTASWRLEVLGWKPPTGLVYDMLTSTWYVWVCAELQASAVKRQGIMWGLYRAFNWVTGHGFFHPQVDRSSNEVKKTHIQLKLPIPNFLCFTVFTFSYLFVVSLPWIHEFLGTTAFSYIHLSQFSASCRIQASQHSCILVNLKLIREQKSKKIGCGKNWLQVSSAKTIIFHSNLGFFFCKTPEVRAVEWRLIVLESFAGVPGFMAAMFRWGVVTATRFFLSPFVWFNVENLPFFSHLFAMFWKIVQFFWYFAQSWRCVW